MTLQELGAILHEERERKGLQIDDIAVTLKISPRVLRGMEEGDTSEVPHPVYLRGFIKSYAQKLGFSADEINAHLTQLVLNEEEAEQQTGLGIPSPAEPSPSTNKKRKIRLLVQLLILTVIAGGAYAYYISNLRGSSWSVASLIDSVTGKPQEQSPSTSPTLQVTERPSAQPTPNLMDSPQPSAPSSLPVTDQNTQERAPALGETNPVTSVTGVTGVTGLTGVAGANPAQPITTGTPTPAAPGIPSAPSAATTPSDPTALPSEATPVTSQFRFPTDAGPGAATQLPTGQNFQEASQTAPTQPAAMPDGMHQVIVTAEADCWIHAKADGTINRQFTLKSGETFSLPFKTSLSMRFGNAGGVKIQYDGKDMGNPGKSGQALTVEFPPKAQ